MRVTIAAIAVCLGVSTSAAAPLFDKALAPPQQLDGIRVGMPRADLAKAMTAFVLDEAYRDAAKRTRYIANVGDAKIYVLFANDVVARIGVEAPASGLVAKLTALWGTPEARTNAASEGLVTWRAAGQRVDVACRESACRLAFHRELGAAFFGREVAAPGALGQIAMGTPAAKVPAMFRGGAEVPAGVEDVRVVVDAPERVQGYRIVGLPAGAGDMIAAAWGAPAIVDGLPTWYAPLRGLRARYDAAIGALAITEYMPLDALLGKGDKLALPVLGLTAQQLAAAYPRFRAQQGGGTIALPPTELAVAPTLIGVAIDPRSGAVARASFAVPFATAQDKAAILALLERKWGKATGQKRLVFPSQKGKVAAQVDDSASVVVVELSHS